MENIIALSTPPLKSALAIIRASGDSVFDIFKAIFDKKITINNHRESYVGYIKDGEKEIDQVVALLYKGPHSFTGEDMVEIICHGSMLIVKNIIDLFIAKGARLAVNGEFSERAFINKKIDLVQAEGINDMINAISEEAKNISLFSLKGETSQLVIPIKNKIADILSLIEVNIDFPEYEDIEVANKSLIIESCENVIKQIDILIKGGEKGKLIKDGIKTAIVGKPNVGKSSLLNALINEDKAIVTSTPGTTRDIVEASVNLGGIILNLYDTAGIRNTANEIENIGINKALDIIEQADLTLVILDASKTLDEEDYKILELTKNNRRIVLYNKADLVHNKQDNNIYISAKNKEFSNLTKAILDLFALDKQSFNTPALANARQIGLLKQIKESLHQAAKDATNDLTLDLIAINLQDAYRATLDILGEDNSYDFSKEIFSRFCVGK